MKNLRYPALMVNHEKFRENVRLVTDKCREHGIEVAGVIKASNGMPRIAEDFVASGASIIASSRLEQLESHLFRQTALIHFEFRSYNDNRTAGVVDALAEKVLTETALLALEHIGK